MMLDTQPLVSICLPNLNNAPFLEERLQSIYDQTYSNWELIIVDNFSDDGAYGIFQTHAEREPRIRLSQAPKKGMYANWNNCLQGVKGDYVYIATSDDTMYPDFLEKMVAALEDHPDCDIAHCNLHVIDEEGNRRDDDRWADYATGQYFGELLHLPHIRRAPHDALLHYSGYTVYHSITQVLLRKKLLDRVGPFSTEFGSKADFGWEMKAGFVSDCIHVPEYLATWRKHSAQATQPGSHVWSDHYKMEQRMVQAAENWAVQEEVFSFTSQEKRAFHLPFHRLIFQAEMSEQKKKPGKLITTVLRMLVTHPGGVFNWILEQIRGSSGLTFHTASYMRSLLCHRGVELLPSDHSS